MSGRARAVARANIALAKYWGKCDEALNLPAVPSLSVTLEPMTTSTTVAFDPALVEDELVLDGRAASAGERSRAVELLDRVRALAGIRAHARVVSENAFETAAGLASSASGFAALAGAASAAAGLELDRAALSAMARRASASAARSVYGGFVELDRGTPGDDALAARPLFDASHWPSLRLVVAVTEPGPKKVGSRDAMNLSAESSPYYRAWVEGAARSTEAVRAAVAARDLSRLGEAAEASFLAMHAVAMTSRPPTLYFGPTTLRVLRALFDARDARGLRAFATMDAGPHVKVLCEAGDAAEVEALLDSVSGVVRRFVARPGPGLEIEAG